MHAHSVFSLFYLYSLGLLQPMARSATTDAEVHRILAPMETRCVQTGRNEMRTVLVNRTEYFTCVLSAPVNN